MLSRPVRLAAVASLLSALSACTSLPGAKIAAGEIEAAHVAAVAAFNACDHARFAAAYSERFTFTTSNTRSAYTTKEALGSYLSAACRQQPSPQVSIKSQSLRDHGELAVVSGQYIFVMVNQGRAAEVTQNFTAVLRRESGSWRFVAHHVSLAP
jgi:uncharacterized protein (TIGR02246 family)